MSDYEQTFIWLRSWCCANPACRQIFSGREHQCAFCLTPKDPLPIA